MKNRVYIQKQIDELVRASQSFLSFMKASNEARGLTNERFDLERKQTDLQIKKLQQQIDELK